MSDGLPSLLRGAHDVGGLPAGRVDATEHDYAGWEKRVDAMAVLLAKHGFGSVDERRRAIEGLGAELYERTSYYEKWLAATVQLLLERGVISVDELGRKLAEVAARRSAAGS